MPVSITREQVLSFRTYAQQLSRESGQPSDTAVLDSGVQDTGPDGGRWALTIRGVDVATMAGDELATAWTVRGAPHLYRRTDLPAVATAVRPFSDADAGKRIYDAAKPLREAGIDNLAALDAIAAAMRSIVTEPMVKGEVSTKLTPLMDEPYRRFCRPCNAVHLYEMPFRLAALWAGLELQAGTSPPVLQPIPDFAPGAEVPGRLDVVRSYLRLLGPATHKQVAEYLDAPVMDVKARWPDDAVEVSVGGEPRWVLAGDEDALAADPPEITRLLGPYDLFLQARDRQLVVPEPARVKELWPVLGRPGAVLVRGEIVGTWRPRKTGKKLRVLVDPWVEPSDYVRKAITGEAERLANFRKVPLSRVDIGG
jgi:hypothetical protein